MSIDLLQHKYKIILIFIIISQSKTSSTNIENQQKISEGSSIKYNALSIVHWLKSAQVYASIRFLYNYRNLFTIQIENRHLCLTTTYVYQ